MVIFDMISDALVSPMADEVRREIKKNLEKAAIKAFCAPPIRSNRQNIEAKYDKEISDVAMTSKIAITTLSLQMDSSINGLGQKAIHQTISEHSNKFNDFNVVE